MKKSLYIIPVITVALALTACDSEEYLDKQPILSTTSSTIFSSKDKIEANLLGIYGEAKSYLAYKGAAYNDVRGDDVASLSSNIYECYCVYEMVVGLSTSDNSTTWSSLYSTINEANTFLENIEKAKEIVGADYAQYVAEAKFLRAWSYYTLNKLYGKPYVSAPTSLSVPLRLKAENNTSNDALAQSTVEEVYAQVLSDLSDENIAALPQGGASYDGETRASKAAALTLRQRVYMEEQNWKKAIADGEAITGYSLTTTVADIFNNNINSEVIFSFPMADTNKGGSQQSLAYYYYSGTVFVVDPVYSYRSNEAYNLNKDTRISLLQEDLDGNYKLNKFTDASSFLDWVPLLRYAEVKLNLAEAYYQDGQEEKAKQQLSDVRRRSISAQDDILDINSLSGTALRDAIYLERRAEFVGEGLRALDITRRAENFVKRNGTFSVNDDGYTWPIPTSERVNNDLIK